MKAHFLNAYLPYNILSAFVYVKQFGLDKPLIKKVEYSAVTGFIENDTDYKIILYPMTSLGNEIFNVYAKKRVIPIREISKILNIEIDEKSTPVLSNNLISLYDDINYIQFNLDTMEITHRKNNRKVSISQECVIKIRELLYELHFDVNNLIKSQEAYSKVELIEKYNISLTQV